MTIKKNVISASFKPVFIVEGLVSICFIIVLWEAKCLSKSDSTDHSHNSFATLTVIHTHNIELFQLHLEQCVCTEEDTYPSAPFSCFDHSCMHTNACLYKHTHTPFYPKHFITCLSHTYSQTYHERCWPNHPEQLGLSVTLGDTLTCGQKDPRIKQPTLCFTCHSNALRNKDQAVLYMCRDYSESLMIWSCLNWSDLALRDMPVQKSPRLALTSLWWPGHHPDLTLLPSGGPASFSDQYCHWVTLHRPCLSYIRSLLSSLSAPIPQ